MKKLRLFSILAVCSIATVVVSLGAVAQRKGEDCPKKVLVCHLKASGEYVQILVGPDQLEWHLSHGDCLGSCPCVVKP